MYTASVENLVVGFFVSSQAFEGEKAPALARSLLASFVTTFEATLLSLRTDFEQEAKNPDQVMANVSFMERFDIFDEVVARTG